MNKVTRETKRSKMTLNFLSLPYTENDCDILRIRKFRRLSVPCIRKESLFLHIVFIPLVLFFSI